MSGFCVYGMTDFAAMAAAKKKRPPRDYEGTLEDFFNETSERIYKTSSHKQVSPAFDAPQFCREWIDLAKKTAKHRGLKIMCRGEKLDKHGSPRINKRTKRPVIGWIPYKDEP